MVPDFCISLTEAGDMDYSDYNLDQGPQRSTFSSMSSGGIKSWKNVYITVYWDLHLLNGWFIHVHFIVCLRVHQTKLNS